LCAAAALIAMLCRVCLCRTSHTSAVVSLRRPLYCSLYTYFNDLHEVTTNIVGLKMRHTKSTIALSTRAVCAAVPIWQKTEKIYTTISKNTHSEHTQSKTRRNNTQTRAPSDEPKRESHRQFSHFCNDFKWTCFMLLALP
jgi:hypothetical protein